MWHEKRSILEKEVEKNQLMTEDRYLHISVLSSHQTGHEANTHISDETKFWMGVLN